MNEMKQHKQETEGRLLETLKLHALIQITHLIDTERYNEACKVAKAVERMSRI